MGKLKIIYSSNYILGVIELIKLEGVLFMVIRKCLKCNKIGIYNEGIVHGANGCNGDTIECNISYNDFIILCSISDDNDFFQAMIDLKEKDIIEYNLKMSQFRTQLEQQKASKAQSDTTPKCPHCHSSNIRPISGLGRGASVAMWGAFSKKINKSFECKSCGYTW